MADEEIWGTLPVLKKCVQGFSCMADEISLSLVGNLAHTDAVIH